MLGAAECRYRYWRYRNQSMSHDEAFDEVHRDIQDSFRDESAQVLYMPQEIERFYNRHYDKINRRYNRRKR